MKCLVLRSVVLSDVNCYGRIEMLFFVLYQWLSEPDLEVLPVPCCLLVLVLLGVSILVSCRWLQLTAINADSQPESTGTPSCHDAVEVVVGVADSESESIRNPHCRGGDEVAGATLV